VSSLEAPSNTQVQSTTDDVAITYAGTTHSPAVVLATTSTCTGSAFYTRIGSLTASVTAFANATSLSVSVPASGTLYLYRCCGEVSVAPRASPVQCSSALRRYSFEAAALKAEADTNLQAALNAPNTYGSLNVIDYTSCHIRSSGSIGGMTYPEGYWFINATTNKNCTCTQAAFSCVAQETPPDIWTSGQVAVVATLSTVGGLVVIAVIIYALLRQQRVMKPSAIPRMETIPNPAGHAQEGFERERL